MLNKKLVLSTFFAIVLATLGILFTNTSGEPNYSLECSRKPQCQTILNAMEEGVGQDLLAGAKPLTPARILDHASHRLGYGLSTIDQSFLPDRMTASHLPKVAWIIYSQVYGEDPTLEGLKLQLDTRKNVFGRLVSESTVSRKAFRCFNRDVLKMNGQLNLTNMPTLILDQKMREIIAEQNQITPRSSRECAFPGTGASNALSLITLQKELLDAAFGTQYFNGTVAKDLQMSYDKVIHEFWFNHFNIDTSKPRIPAFGLQSYENTITQNQFTSFRQLLGAVIKHPGMLQYLDNDSNSIINIKNSSNIIVDQIASNQNLGRELLELHTFGLGPNTIEQPSPYNQSDVEVASLIFTGHTVRNSVYTFVPQISANRINYVSKFFTQRSAETRPLFFNQSRLATLDSTALENRLDFMLDQLSQNPRVLRNICSKFTTRFVLASRTSHASIYQSCLAQLQTETGAGNGGTQLQRMYMSIVHSPQFWTFISAQKQLGNPVEIVVKNIRTLGIPFSTLGVGDLGNTSMSRLANFMVDSILDMGLSYRKFGDPTGYEMRGPEWLSQGYLLNHARLSFEYAHLHKLLDSNYRERALTITPLQEQSLRNLTNASTAASVAQTVYAPARGIASIATLSRDQADDLIEIGDMSTSSNQLDVVDGNRSVIETVYSLMKAHINEMRR